jgi:transcriptional regulator with XRE-family HTH domain
MAAGFRVAEERSRLDLSQQQLADRVTRLGYKITQTGIDKIEKRDTARPKCLKELALALNVTQEWLLTGQEPKHIVSDQEFEELRKDARLLPPDEQETLIAQFRSLLHIALKKDRRTLR